MVRIALYLLLTISTVACAQDFKIEPGSQPTQQAADHAACTDPECTQEHVVQDPTNPPRKKLTKQDKRKRKRGYKKKTYREYTYDELKLVRNKLRKNGDLEGAIRVAERMVPMCKKLIELEELSLDLADLIYEYGDFEKSAKLYTEFAKLYPGNTGVERALYRAITCNFNCILDAERDQTRTKDTIELTKQFLERADVFKDYVQEVEEIQRNCYTRLFESEMNVVDFYLNRGSLRSAQKRLENIKKEYLELLPSLEVDTLRFEIKLAEKQALPDIVLAKRSELAQRFPTTNEVIQIADAQKSSSFVNKF